MKIFNFSRGEIPKHVAIIPDGNRRWARASGISYSKSYETSGNNLYELFGEAKKLGVKYLTFWVFSTDNWKRSEDETKKLFNLFYSNLDKLKEELVKNKIRFRHFGRKDRLPSKLVEILDSLEEQTKNFRKFHVQFCMDYGGRDELVRAVNKMLKEKINEISEEDFVNFLDSAELPNPDLVIRTSGEKRTSGFMPYQTAYSEYYFSDILFPDFKAGDLREAVKDYGKRKRNYGM